VESGEAGVSDSGAGEHDRGPDFLLQETARIVSDMAELESNRELLERRFSQLNEETPRVQKIN